MKRLDTSAISATTAMPIKSGTLEFLQDAYKETIASIVSNIVEDPQPSTIYILSGCKNSATLPAHNISAGVLFIDGEVYEFAGATFTLSGLQKAYARIETTQYITNADPVQFTDGVNRNVHNIRKIVIEATSVSSGLPEFKDFVPAGKFFKGETKNIVMTSGEYAAKFVQSGGTAGLGKFEFTGWAVMNGNNDTEDDDGYVEMAYGATHSALETPTGSATKTLAVANLPNQGEPVVNGSPTTIGLNGGTTFNLKLGVAGSGTAFSIVQPSKVRLRIQKI